MSKSLPAKYIVRLGKFVWTTMWQIMMSQLAPPSREGEYLRPSSQFRNFIGTEENNPYPPATGRYRLYVGMGCPWAHRTLVVRVLKGLEEVISVATVYPSSNEGIWIFDQSEEGCNTLPEIYQLAQPGYQGRCTVPVLWDTQTKTIVNNESAEIIVMLNSEFNQWATNSELDLYPEILQPQIDSWNEKVYHAVNNGVYRCGFAQTQSAYNQACEELFQTLDEIDLVLADKRYLCGEQVTLADVRLFTTLFRFDVVYYGLFKCNLRRIQDYPHLGRYLRDLYQLPGVATTCDLESIKRDYYGNLFPLNPGGIIPLGPDLANL
ncbi:Glutathione transferase [Stanieria cyanosphaera PCC 7437]|uniref:Glutathione transferase n=1 Tax=Stanieria cyanosphaera (strain ATCC 29371 / PCC 7437) TaxID=111780 RepID=K9XP37_STAC7|nr:glutathione S-transferase family protein [Stanieria cyanosphaera]AFZ33811.1 Glutathione transferase [Stanieria cyanosphaera PCC 7437]